MPHLPRLVREFLRRPDRRLEDLLRDLATHLGDEQPPLPRDPEDTPPPTSPPEDRAAAD